MMRFRILTAALSLFILLAPYSPAWAQDADVIGAMESQLFTRQFKQETQEERLTRLENTIFGEVQKGDAAGRTRHLQSVLKVSAPMAEPQQSASRQASGDPNNALSGNPQDQEPQEKDTTDYPTVTSLERQVFRQSYVGEDVTGRLKRLEQEVFKQSFDELPMVDRVDQLTLKVMPNSALGVEEGVLSALPNRSSDFAGSSGAVYSQLTALEEQILGRAYGGDMLTNRLSRLEQQVFGGPRSGSVDARVDQLVAKYPSRLQQSGWQSPTARFQSPSGYRFGDSSNRINRAVGQSLSPEMVSMLPPHVRNQVQQGTLPPPEQYHMAPQIAPQQPDFSVNQSTQMIPQQVYTPPQSLYRVPGTVSPQGYAPTGPRQTPVIPYGNQSYGTPLSALGQVLTPQQNPPSAYPDQQQMNGMGMMPQQPMYPQQQMMMPQQNMMGYGQQMMVPMGQQSSLVQSVSMLESQVFGQTYTGSTLIQRLNNLEKNVFGTTYPKYSPQQRINRLMNKATPQGALPGNPLNKLLGQNNGKNDKKSSFVKSALGTLMQGTLMNSGFMGQAQEQDATYVDPYGTGTYY